jgi:hypothetical protein
MGLLKRILGGGHDNPDPDDVPVLGRFREARPCNLHYSDQQDSNMLCASCGWTLGAHELVSEEHMQDIRKELAVAADGRAPQTRSGQLITGEETTRLRATELIERAGDSVPALAQALTVIAERFEQSVQASHQLNRGLDEFREKAIAPLQEELKYLRFNLGDKVNKTTTNMEVMVDELDKVIWGALRAGGLTDAEIRTFRTEHGMNPEAPSGQELELHVAQTQGLLDQVAALTAQNQRLLAQLGASHVFREGESGEYRYHPGCECRACTEETVRVAAAQHEASGGARKQAKPRDRRKNRRG